MLRDFILHTGTPLTWLTIRTDSLIRIFEVRISGSTSVVRIAVPSAYGWTLNYIRQLRKMVCFDLQNIPDFYLIRLIIIVVHMSSHLGVAGRRGCFQWGRFCHAFGQQGRIFLSFVDNKVLKRQINIKSFCILPHTLFYNGANETPLVDVKNSLKCCFVVANCLRWE